METVLLHNAINTFSDRIEHAKTDKVPYGFGIAAAFDTLADGLIIGAGFAASGEAGTFLTIALGLELMTLNLSVGREFLSHGSGRKLTVIATTVIAMMMVIGAFAGASLFGELDNQSLAAVLSVSSAAGLYLAAQELLFMGQRIERSSLTIAAFFLGFMVLMAFTLFRLGNS